MICRLSTTCREQKAKWRSEKEAGLNSSAACRGVSVKGAEDEPNYDFKRFYQEVKKRDYIPYPGKLTEVETFRVGCIGDVDEAGIPDAVIAIADTLRAMGVSRVSAETAA
ncbi:2-aminoethylphosphonate-pyruvate transaminase [Burkholderia sp. IT-111MI5]